MNLSRPLVRIRRQVPGASDGQALVEFALVLTPLILALFGVIQLGLLFGSQVGLSNAARESARHTSAVITSNGTSAATNGAAACTDLVTRRLPQGVPAFSKAALTTSAPRTRVGFYYYAAPGTSPTMYSVRVVVEVQYRQILLLPLVGTALDGFDGTTDSRLRLGAREEMRVEGPLLADPPPGLSLGAPGSWVTCS